MLEFLLKRDKRLPAKGVYSNIQRWFLFALITLLFTSPALGEITNSTYIGGSLADNAYGSYVDNNGFIYIVGETDSTDFPIVGGYQTTNAGGTDAFLAKFSPGGSNLVYSTYLGGSGNDSAKGITVDVAGNIYISGQTFSSDFPTTNAVQGTFGGTSDAYITVLNSNGTALIYSSYLGGIGTDSGGTVKVDGEGNAYIYGMTDSTNYPTASAIQSTYGGGTWDSFLTILDPSGTGVVVSTYLGGPGNDFSGYGCQTLALDGNTNIYVTGMTDSSTGFPITNAFQSAYGGGNDAFVTKFSPMAASIIYSTYFGGTGQEIGESIDVTPSGEVVFSGDTRSTDMPVSNAYQSIYGGAICDGYIAKLAADGVTLIFSSYIGGVGDDTGVSVAIAPGSGDIYLSGGTVGATNFPILNAFQPIFGGGSYEAYIARFSSSGTLLNSSYLGGIDYDWGTISILADGEVYIAGNTASTNFPVLYPYQALYAGGAKDSFLTKINYLSPPSSPFVTNTFPLANALNVSNAVVVSAMFDQDMNPATLTTNNFFMYSGMSPTYRPTPTYDSTNFTATLDPAPALKPGEIIYVDVTKWVEGTNGLQSAPHLWQFRVGVQGGSGTFTNSGQAMGVSSNDDVCLGDLDGDGDLDAFVAARNQGNEVWTNDGSGVFFNTGQALGSSASKRVRLGDLDGDGDLDAFVANQEQANKVWTNDGSGLFFDSGQALGSFGSYGVALGDLDGDGDLDALVVNNFPDTTHRVWENDGSGSFSNSSSFSSPVGVMSVALGDVDGDGDLDAVLANNGDANEIWLNNGSGVFSDSGQNLGTALSEDVKIGDLDGDGDLDAFFANSNEGNTIWTNDGSGLFFNSGQSLSNLNSYGVSLGDIDGDGDLDALTGNVSQPNKIWINNAGIFTDTMQDLGAAITKGGVAFGDMDSDGDLDAFIANYGVADTVWLNGAPGGGAAPVIENNPPAVISDTEANMYGNLISTGDSPTEVWCVWGMSDQGMVFGDWDTNTYLGFRDFGTTSNYQGALIPDTQYFYSYYASNSFGEAWAPSSTNFYTPPSGGGDPDFEIDMAQFYSLSGQPVTFTITAIDGTNIMSGYTGTVFFASAEASVLPSNYTFTAIDNGVRIFTNGVTFTNSGDNTQFQVEDTMDSGMSETLYNYLVFNNTGNTHERLWIFNIDDPLLTNEISTLSVASMDDNWNLNTAFVGTVNFASSDPGAYLPLDGAASYSFSPGDAGVKTFTNLYFTTIGEHWVTATDQADTNISDVGMSITVQGSGFDSNVTHFAIEGPFNISSGQWEHVSIWARNSLEHDMNDFTGTVSISCSDPAASFGGATNQVITTNDYGEIHLMSFIQFNTPGIHSIDVFWVGNPSITGRIDNIQVNADGGGGNPTFEIDADNSMVLASSWQTFTLTAFDDSGNIESNYSGTVTFFSSDPGATLPSDFPFTGAEGGVVVFTNELMFANGGKQEFYVEEQGLPSRNALEDFDVLVGGATNTTHFLFDVDPRPCISNQWHDILVIAVGEGNLVNTNYANNVDFTTTDGMGSFLTTPFNSFTNGFAIITNQVNLKTTGLQTITITDSVDTNIYTDTDVYVVGGGTLYYVDEQNGSDGNAGSGPGIAWQTIAHAATNASDGDVILVAPGHYSESIRPITGGSAGLWLSFVGDHDARYFPGLPSGDIFIDPGALPAFYLDNLSYVSISGFEIGGDTSNTGILASSCDNIIIAGNEFEDCDTAIDLNSSIEVLIQNICIDMGGTYGIHAANNSDNLKIEMSDISECGTGIELTSSTNYVIEGCLIESNSNDGVSLNGGAGFGQIRGCRFIGNGAYGILGQSAGMSADINHNVFFGNANGGLMLITADPGSLIINNTFYDNVNGIVINDTDGTIIRNNIVMNHSADGINIDAPSTNSSVWEYNCAYGNTTDWSGISQGLGSISLDPYLADETPGQEDLHLQSTAGRFSLNGYTFDGLDSPCIDTGKPVDPFDNEPAPNGGQINMGAFGNTREASLSYAVITNDLLVTSLYDSPLPDGTGTTWYTEGFLINASVLSPVADGVGTQQVCTGWAGTGSAPTLGTSNSVSFNITNTSTLAWSWITEVDLMVNPDLNGFTDATNGWHTMGSSNIINAIPSNGYQFAGWIGDIVTTSNPVTVVMNQAYDITPTFTEITNDLFVSSLYDSPLPDGTGTTWYTEGFLVNASVTPAIADGVGTQQVCTGWAGTGSAPISGTSNSVSFNITNTSTLAWSWITEVDLMVNPDLNGFTDATNGWHTMGSSNIINAIPSNGYQFAGWIGDIVTTSNPVTVVMNQAYDITPTFTEITNDLFVSSLYDSPLPDGTGTTWYTEGFLVNASVTPAIADGVGTQQVCTGWAGTGSAPTLGTSNSVSFNITNTSTLAWSWITEVDLMVNPDLNGFTDATNGWHTMGSSNIINAIPSNGYQFAGWIGDIVTTSNPVTVVMNQAYDITPTFTEITNDLLVSSFYDNPLPDGTGTTWYTEGFLINASVTSPLPDGVGTQQVCTGWAGTGSAPISGTSNSVSFNITNTSTLAWSWITEVDLMVNPDLNGFTDATNGWNTMGSSNIINAIPSNGYQFAGWIGDIVTTSNPVTVVMNQAYDITPTFTEITNDLFVSSLYDSPLPDGTGTTWYTEGFLVNASVTPAIADGVGTQQVCTGWAGTGSAPISGTSNSVSFNITNTSTLAWSWITEVDLMVNPDLNGFTDATNGWHTMGSSNIINAIPSNGYQFAGWIGDIVTTSNPVTVVMNQAYDITPTFTEITNDLLVSSPYDSPLPDGTGTTWYTEGFLINASVTPAIADGVGTQQVCTGWAGTGSAPISGTSNSVSFNITNTSTLAWSWMTEVDLMVNPDPNGFTDATNGWHTMGSSNIINAIPSNGYQFAGWIGDIVTTSNPVTVVMNQAYDITPTFTEITNDLLVSSPYDSPLPDGTGTTWYTEGFLINASVTPAIADGVGTQQVCTGWAGTGSAPTLGTSNSVSFNITNTSTLAWSWMTEVDLMVNPDINGTTDAINGWYAMGSSNIITATPTNGYEFTGWTGDIVTTSNPVTVVMNQAYDITPTYAITNHTITASAGPNGAITPLGGISVINNGTTNFTITPNPTFMVTNVYIDGAPIGSTNSYTFSAVTAGHTIDALFGPIQHVLTIDSANPTSGVAIVVSPNDVNAQGAGATAFNRLYNEGTVVTLTAPATSGPNTFSKWQREAADYTTNLVANITASNSFTMTAIYVTPQYSLTVTTPQGTVIPAGVTMHDSGTNIDAFVTASPVNAGNTRYVCTDYVGTGSVGSGAGTNISFSITANSTLTWNWSTQHVFNASANPGGSVVATNGWYNDGIPVVSALAVASNGYTFAGWTGDIVSGVNPLATPIDQPYSIVANYTITQWTITATAGGNGSITPVGGVLVNHDANQGFTITPNANYHINDVTVDGPSVGTPGTYTFNNVTANHAINATFAVDIGNIQCVITPAAAVAAGAQWQIVEAPGWRDSGSIATGLAATSTYTIQFRATAGWTTPGNINTVPIADGATTQRSGNYLATGGMIGIPGGSFTMGVYDGLGGINVNLSPFQMDVTEVTVANYMVFVNSITSISMPPVPDGWTAWTDNTSRPMCNVKWNEAAAYAAWMGKCLPTEAQFEYAMRSGQNAAATDWRYSYGDTITTLQANYGSAATVPAVVSSYPATAYGLRDIAGNVWEWCSDWYSDTLAGGNDPAGPTAVQDYKTKRGGAWISFESNLRSARRYSARPRVRYRDVGFRCVIPSDGRTPDGDSNDNGVPDWWEMWYFGLEAGGAGGTFDGGADADTDGTSNANEYIQGTDPTDPSPELSVGGTYITIPVTGFVLEWPSSGAPRYYRIERSANAGGPWSTIASGIPSAVPPDGYSMTFNSYTDVTAMPTAFYRIEVTVNP